MKLLPSLSTTRTASLMEKAAPDGQLPLPSKGTPSHHCPEVGAALEGEAVLCHWLLLMGKLPAVEHFLLSMSWPHLLAG